MVEITAKEVKELRKAKLGHVCVLNGQLKDARTMGDLSQNDLKRAQEIVAGHSTKGKGTRGQKGAST